MKYDKEAKLEEWRCNPKLPSSFTIPLALRGIARMIIRSEQNKFDSIVISLASEMHQADKR